ncbi:MAG: methylated-DNA--[protein]-cysteine S-methyltransferase [Kiloniellales bacterium]|nr:methylated-DNA--[protein]-cysteine S-methyltransferase [Kiloniellales bacterium]
MDAQMTVSAESTRKSSSAATAPAKAASRSQLALVERACALIDARAGERVTLGALGEELGVSPWHLQRLFRKVMGVSPRDYADALRSGQFRRQLRQGESIAGATYGAGYGSSSRVYEVAGQQLGMTPATYARGGRGASIVYAVVDSPLGRLLVAATEAGVCFVSLGEDDGELVTALEAEFPEADTIERDDARVGPSLDALVAYLSGETPHVDLPLDVRATAFQRRVWQELIAIPLGETRSYSEIAARLGLPKGQRAVGRACATNPVSLIIPCHRALRESGELGGYRWGLKRKRALLEHEIALAEAG